jgi:hypothetical protein
MTPLQTTLSNHTSCHAGTSCIGPPLHAAAPSPSSLTPPLRPARPADAAGSAASARKKADAGEADGQGGALACAEMHFAVALAAVLLPHVQGGVGPFEAAAEGAAAAAGEAEEVPAPASGKRKRRQKQQQQAVSTPVQEGGGGTGGWVAAVRVRGQRRRGFPALAPGVHAVTREFASSNICLHVCLQCLRASRCCGAA